MCRYSTLFLTCPSPMPSYTCPGRKAATPNPHPAARGPWRSSMLCRPQKNVSLLPRARVVCGDIPAASMACCGLPCCVLLALGVQKALCLSWPAWFHCRERKSQVSGQKAEAPLSAAEQELGSGIARGPSFVGRSQRNSSLPLTRFGIIVGGSRPVY